MAARDPKLPVVIDLEEDDSVSLIPWEFVVDKCDGIVGGGITPNIQNINIDLARINNRIQQWIDAQRGNPQSTSEDFKATEYEDVFNDLIDVVYAQRQLIHTMANLLEQLDLSGGGGGSAVLIDKTITRNGTFNARDDSADGYRSVTVEVPESGGFQPYETDQEYVQYQTVVDPETMVAYMVIAEQYTSVDIRTDCQAGNLKLIGFDSQIVPFDHPPTAEEINALPENALVVEYDPDDTPYTGILSNDINT